MLGIIVMHPGRTFMSRANSVCVSILAVDTQQVTCSYYKLLNGLHNYVKQMNKHSVQSS